MPRPTIGAWTERALYLSLLWLSSDAAPPIPTATNTASEVANSLEPIPPLDHSPPLALPVRGEWTIPWAGSDHERSLRRALIFAMVDAEGKTHRNDGLVNHDYYAYGQPIHAMAAGEVVMVVDGVPDNEPGQRGPYQLGNTIVIRQQENLHAVYALLIPGSATVKVGDHVEREQILGKCGNSGRAREPRVHIHLQDGFIIGKAWGVEPIFAD
jgi:murein DD-endopeptidase MepM/ murein hydrolase activator NlpD